MILGAAFCPHPPLLVPALASSAAAEVADLLAACDAAIATAAAAGGRIVVLGADAATGRRAVPSSTSLRGYGGDRTELPASDLPLSLTIGAWLLERFRPGLADVGLLGIGPASGPVEMAAAEQTARAMIDETKDTTLLVMGDGSARRGPKAPGYLDDRAVGFDAGVRAAIVTADAEGLAALDADLGVELLAAGVPAWRVAGALLGGAEWTPRLYFEGDPFGVYYLAGAWTPALTGP